MIDALPANFVAGMHRFGGRIGNARKLGKAWGYRAADQGERKDSRPATDDWIETMQDTRNRLATASRSSEPAAKPSPQPAMVEPGGMTLRAIAPIEDTLLAGIAPLPEGGGRRLADAPDFLSVAEAAAILGVSRNLVWRAIADGQLAAIRIGRRVLVPRLSLVRLIDEATGR